MEGSQIVVLKKNVRGIGFGGGAVHGDKLRVFGLTRGSVGWGTSVGLVYRGATLKVPGRNDSNEGARKFKSHKEDQVLLRQQGCQKLPQAESRGRHKYAQLM